MADKALYITTSWDDGHPCDMRLAEMLAKHGLRATFYVPLRNHREVVTDLQIRMLNDNFEIGGHTIHHCDLSSQSLEDVDHEISGCKNALEQITARPCRSFCFPMGRFRRGHLNLVRKAGFSLARTVELMSVAAPAVQDGLAVMPTTLQALSAGPNVYLKNSLKRLRPSNLLRYRRNRRSTWVDTLRAILNESLRHGGIIHLWGHSWEINENSDWDNVEEAFSILGSAKGRAKYVTNGELLLELANGSSN